MKRSHAKTWHDEVGDFLLWLITTPRVIVRFRKADLIALRR
jgi:hypothetical protein